jgi:hypothetical protein
METKENKNNDIFEFTKILKKKKIKGKIYYKVEWKDGSIPTLEPKKNFINCDELIENFELQEKKRKLIPNHRKIIKKSLIFGKKKENNISYRTYGKLNRDYPLKIVNVEFNNENIENTNFEIEWYKRVDGVKPRNTKIPLVKLFNYSKHTRVFLSKFLLNYLFEYQK